MDRLFEAIIATYGIEYLEIDICNDSNKIYDLSLNKSREFTEEFK